MHGNAATFASCTVTPLPKFDEIVAGLAWAMATEEPWQARNGLLKT